MIEKMMKFSILTALLISLKIFLINTTYIKWECNMLLNFR